MRKYENGVYRDMTQTEIETMKNEVPEAKETTSLEDRVSVLEAMELERMLGGN